jgi:hypothetical protein
MAIYTVHLPPDATTADTVAEKAVFIKEGFSFFGFAFTGLWLLAQRLWLMTLIYVAVLGLVLAAFAFLDLPRPAFGVITLLMGLLVGLEGHEWQRRKYARLGWIHAGTVSGPSLDECERRFFKDWTMSHNAARGAAPPLAAMSMTGAPAPAPRVLGVFPSARGQA